MDLVDHLTRALINNLDNAINFHFTIRCFSHIVLNVDFDFAVTFLVIETATIKLVSLA